MTSRTDRTSPAATLTKAKITARGAGYALFIAAGVIGAVTGPLSLVAVMGDRTATVWGVWLTIGGLACLLGVLTGTWVGEFVGMPLLVSALVGYAYAVARYADSPLGAWRWGGAALLVAVCCGLIDRLLDVVCVSGIHRRVTVED